MVRLGVSPSNQPRSSIKSSASQRADSRSMSKGFKNYQYSSYSSSGKINIAIAFPFRSAEVPRNAAAIFAPALGSLTASKIASSPPYGSLQ